MADGDGKNEGKRSDDSVETGVDYALHKKFDMPIKVVVADNVMVKVDIAFKSTYPKLKWIQMLDQL
ncbi:hypothetical protein LXL04_028079 [Taraxacum kok-saghyz]